MDEWKLRARLDNIIESNTTSYEYEGDELDKAGLKDDIIDLIREITESK
jgi:hypothetical protein